MLYAFLKSTFAHARVRYKFSIFIWSDFIYLWYIYFTRENAGKELINGRYLYVCDFVERWEGVGAELDQVVVVLGLTVVDGEHLEVANVVIVVHQDDVNGEHPNAVSPQ